MDIGTLALQLAAPMQSWGTRSRFTRRDTAQEPTKSGIVGLLMAALGRPRDDDACVQELATLRLGVRVDLEGTTERDYHTISNVASADAKNSAGVVSNRYYLADAAFLAVLEGEPAQLEELYHALLRPRWPLYLGRRSFLPSLPLVLPESCEYPSLGELRLEESLAAYPWLEQRGYERRKALRTLGQPEQRPNLLRTVTDTVPTHPAGELRHDHPVSFRPDDRRRTPHRRDRAHPTHSGPHNPYPRVGHRLTRRPLPGRTNE